MAGLHRNLKLFVAFRVLFNARFYYPVLGVLFLDLGLSLEQYALLNVVWAVTIVLCEVPSGAMADLIGRRRMVVLAAGLMVLEMALFAFAPTHWPELLFWLLVLNRVLSGFAEASASGADEALAYDSLPEDERATRWPQVLESLMRWQSGAFFMAMILGAALFDAGFLNRAGMLIGFEFGLEGETTVRWPVYATLVTAGICFLVALAMVEPGHTGSRPAPSLALAWRNIWLGARQVVTDRRILLIMLAALLGDSLVRLFLTFGSNYYRLIELPEVANGLLGSGMALLGFVAAPVARKLVGRRNVVWNFLTVAGCVLIGLIGCALATPLWGAWVILPLGLSMSLLQFFLSHYLNTWTDSSVRATVLSFKGVALNLGYGTVGLLFAGLTGRLRTENPFWSENEIFGRALWWLPPAFLIGLLALGTLAALWPTKRKLTS